VLGLSTYCILVVLHSLHYLVPSFNGYYCLVVHYDVNFVFMYSSPGCSLCAFRCGTI
jgi:hypothetical protein